MALRFTISRRVLSALSAMILAALALGTVDWRQLEIRWLIWRLGKDRSYESPHLYSDRSSQKLKQIGPSAIP